VSVLGGCCFFLKKRRPPEVRQGVSSAASDVDKRRDLGDLGVGEVVLHGNGSFLGV